MQSSPYERMTPLSRELLQQAATEPLFVLFNSVSFSMRPLLVRARKAAENDTSDNHTLSYAVLLNTYILWISLEICTECSLMSQPYAQLNARNIGEFANFVLIHSDNQLIEYQGIAQQLSRRSQRHDTNV